MTDTGMRVDTAGIVDTRFSMARGFFERGHVAQAEALLRELVALAPAREDVAMLLGDVLRSQGRLSNAAEVMRSLAEASDFDEGIALRGATFARGCDRHEVAARICEDALTRGAKLPELMVLAGHLSRELGDFTGARERYLAALDGGIDLERNHVLAALANTKRYSDPADADIARCERHFRETGHSTRSRASAGFGLAKAMDDLGDFAGAARVLRDANRMVRSVQRWDRAAWRTFVNARESERVEASRNAPRTSFVPVFIVGLPRTGTTLTATLLARATCARDRGELRTLRYIGEQLAAGGHLGDAEAVGEAAKLYRTLAAQDDAPTTWYLDQDPLNFRWLHVAAAMYSNARVIHLRRDPKDTALSLWSQDFAHPDLAFAYDFDDMAAYMACQVALMQHWKRLLEVPILDLDYEALVGCPDATLAALCDFVGVPTCKNGCVESNAPVQSASVWQARQAVYTTSVGRWRNYRPFVPELARFAESTR